MPTKPGLRWKRWGVLNVPTHEITDYWSVSPDLLAVHEVDVAEQRGSSARSILTINEIQLSRRIHCNPLPQIITLCTI